MAISTSLLNDINAALGGIPSNLTSASAADNIYEVYLFTLILKAAENEGASVKLKNENKSPVTTLYFRSSPGYLSSNRQNYSYAEILFPNKPDLEAHVSIRVSGVSNVLHEFDICVLQKEEADLCRSIFSKSAPRSSKVILNVEAKFYTTSLALDLGRSFLGLTTDVSSLSEAFFITNTSSSSIEKLLSHKKKSWEHNIKPTNADTVNRLIPLFQKVFKDFKAKYQ